MTSVITAESFGNWISQLNIGRIAGVVTLVLLLILAFSLARLTWELISPGPVLTAVPVPDRLPEAQAGAGETPDRPAVESVARLHLFGRADPAEQPAMADIDAPETRLRLQLRGVVAALPAGQGIALIADEGGEERHYLPGAEVPGGATLEQVHSDRVVLRREGRFELLRLPRDAPLSGEAPATPAAQPQPIAGSGAAGGVLPEEMRRQWLDDPTALFESIQVQPVMQDGTMRGFAISPRRDARMFRAVGLRPGDVVTAINGITVAGMTDPTAIRDQLAGANEIRLDIERNGRPDTVVVPIGQ